MTSAALLLSVTLIYFRNPNLRNYSANGNAASEDVDVTKFPKEKNTRAGHRGPHVLAVTLSVAQLGPPHTLAKWAV